MEISSSFYFIPVLLIASFTDSFFNTHSCPILQGYLGDICILCKSVFNHTNYALLHGFDSTPGNFQKKLRENLRKYSFP